MNKNLYYTNDMIQIYFGNKHDALYPHEYQHFFSKDDLYQHNLLASRMKQMGLQGLMFLKQVHSVQGLVVDSLSYASIESFGCAGDYLITDLSHIGIGVLVADCLPIVLHDVCTNSIGIIHAGWKGTAQSILSRTIQQMGRVYGSTIGDIRIFFGPSAQSCCYQVQELFKQSFKQFSYYQDLFREKNGLLYFDLMRANSMQAYQLGVSYQSINREYAFCTICDDSFYSYRRNGDSSGRQIVIVSLV